MRFPHGISVTVRRRPPGTVDRFGDPLPAIEHTVEPCALVNKGSTEISNNRMGTEMENNRLNVFTSALLLAPAGADFMPGDEVVTPDGRVWQVDGEPLRPNSPFTGWRPGTKVTLRRYTG